MMVYDVAAYVRLSAEDNEQNSIQTQEEYIKDYIAQQDDLRFVETFADNGETGTNFERPAFQRMMEAVKLGRINCVVVKDLSRLGRDYIEVGRYMNEIFPLMGVRFIAINDDHDSMTKIACNYIIPLKNIINTMYAKDISAKVQSSILLKQKQGLFIGNYAPYGYRKDPYNPEHLLVDEQTAPIVQEIFHWRAQGKSFLWICRELDALGIPSPLAHLSKQGNYFHQDRFAEALWYPKVIQQILRSETYLGHLVQGKRKNLVLNRATEMPPEDWIRVENTHAPIIEKGLFEQVQSIPLQTKNQGKKYPKTPYLLQSYMFCKNCGTTLIRRRVTRLDKETGLPCTKYRYSCSMHQRYPNRCDFISVWEDDVLEAVSTVLKLCPITQEADSTDDNAQIATLKKTLRDIEQNIITAPLHRRKLFEQYCDQEMSKEDYLQSKENSERNEDYDRKQMTRFRALLAKQTEKLRLPKPEKEVTEEMKRATLERYLQRIEVDQNKGVYVILKQEWRDKELALRGEFLRSQDEYSGN